MTRVLFGCLIFSIMVFSAFMPGDKVEDFSLKDYNGKNFKLSDYKNSKAVVLIFVATECPVSNAYNERMAAVYRDYKDKNISFLGINSNNTESIEDIKLHAKKNKLYFPILKDNKNIIADKLNASVTPEVYVLNNNREVIYHGRIDDSRNESGVKNRDLRDVLDSVISNKEIKTSRTKAFGCTIKRI